jgi:hypothetical protein
MHVIANEVENKYPPRRAHYPTYKSRYGITLALAGARVKGRDKEHTPILRK